MSVPLGVFAYSSVSASNPPLGDVSSFWKRPKAFKFKRARTDRRQSVESAGSLIRSNCRLPSAKHSAQSDPSSPTASHHSSCQTRTTHVPIVIPSYEVTPDSPCTSFRLSSSRTSTFVSSSQPSLSGYPLPSRKSICDSSSVRSRHVEILIPDWALPVQRFSTSPINLRFDFERPQTPVLPNHTRSPASMARHTPGGSRTNTIDSQTTAPSPSQLYSDGFRSGSGHYKSSQNNSQTSLHRQETQDGQAERLPTSSARTPGSGISASPAMTAGLATPTSSTAGLSGLVCNVHRTTGREPYVTPMYEPL